MSFADERFIVPNDDEGAVESGHERVDVAAKIKRLVETQPFTALCTQGQGQPYGSLVAYAMADDLRYATFATPRATRKFRLLSECDQVALLIDNRPEFPNELMKIEAVTATGATRLQNVIYAVVPQIVPPYIAFTLYRWDINVRMSTIIGFAGGGGIGFVLQQNMNLLQYRDASAQMLSIAVVVATLDFVSARVRERIV